MDICIRPHDVGKASSAQLGQKIAQMGFECVQLAIAKAILGQTAAPGTLTQEVVKEIRHGFNVAGLSIPILGAYFNPVHSNAQKALDGQLKFSDHLRLESAFGAEYVASETGSFNDDKWTYNPKNQTKEAFDKVKKVFQELSLDAAKYNAKMSIEGAWGHCIYSPQQMKNLLDEIDNGFVFTTFDLFNYLYAGNYQNRFDIFEEGLKLLGDKIVIFHIKDFTPQGDVLKQVPIGDGIMEWQKLLPVIKQHYPNAHLVFEGVPEPQKSLAFVKNALV